MSMDGWATLNWKTVVVTKKEWESDEDLLWPWDIDGLLWDIKRKKMKLWKNLFTNSSIKFSLVAATALYNYVLLDSESDTINYTDFINIYEAGQKVIRLNNFLDKHLNIKKLKENHNNDMFYKIALTSLLIYKQNFAISPEKIDVSWFDDYLKNVANYLKELYLKNKLEKQDIQKLHYLIMSKLVLEKIEKTDIWNWRTTWMKIRWHNLKGMRVIEHAPSPEYVDKNMIVEIKKLNNILSTNSSQKEKLLAIVKFIMKSFIIHPFANGNGKTFWTLLDLLLWKYNFFPSFPFHKDLKLKVHKEVFDYYTETKNENVLIDKFLIFLSYVYSHYKF